MQVISFLHAFFPLPGWIFNIKIKAPVSFFQCPFSSEDILL
jgi:hypothetical protein